jgi:spore coat protein JC
MWSYDKRLQFPVKIKNPNPQTAKIVISQLGGPDGELGASMRYLNQRYAMPYKECKGILTDIGTEELAHMEMISAIVYQLTRNLTPEQIKEGGFDAYFVDHTTGIYPQSASGVPWSAATFQSKGDPITDLRIWQQKLHLYKNNPLGFSHHFSVYIATFLYIIIRGILIER